MRKAIVLTSSLLISLLHGCATIHFENGEPVPDPDAFSWTFGLFEDEELKQFDAGSSVRFDRWYHMSVYQLAELSNPLELDEVCVGLDWNQVTTKVTPIDALIGLVDNAVLLPASSAGIDLWSPWTIEYSCRNPR